MRGRLLVPAVFTLVSLAILIGLGAWQWRRMAEKQALIATIQSRIAMTPQAYPSIGASYDPAALEYTPVTVDGRFLDAHEAHVFFSLAKPVGGHGGAGFLVLAPFRMTDGRVVLINRGFVPQHLKALETRPDSIVAGPITLAGLMRLPERRTMFSGADDPTKNIYYVRDPAAIARGMGLARIAGNSAIEPFIIDLKAPAPPSGLPVPGVTQIDIPNNHFQYALTWWSLAAVLAAIFLVFAGQQRRGDAGPR